MPKLARPLVRALGTLSVLGALALGVGAAPAAAKVVLAEGVEVGLQARSVTLTDGSFGFGPGGEAFENLGAFEFANAAGEPVLPASHTYAIYWDPTDNYHGDWEQLIDTFFAHMGGSSGFLGSVFAVDAQYTDKQNQHAAYSSAFMGAYTDTDPYPAPTCTDPAPLEGKVSPSGKPAAITCLSDAQIRAELEHFIAGHSLQKGMSSIFYILTPPGVTVCLDGGGSTGHCSDYEASLQSYDNSFCSYHSDISSNPAGDAETVLYAVIPWTAGGAADDHLPIGDRTSAFDCQDGGYDPSSHPVVEEHEEKQEKTLQQEKEEAEKEKTKKEQEAQRLRELQEGPHQQEPNQLSHNGPDGFPDTGLADLITNQIAVEQQNVVTDPLLKSWHDPNGREVTDECRDFFAPVIGGSVSANEVTAAGTLFNQELAGGDYYLNDTFDLASLKLPYPGVTCLNGIDLVPRFTAPNPVNAGEVVGFNGMESEISLNWGTEYTPSGEPKPTYATYMWNFGDGSPEVTGYAPGAPAGNPPVALCEEPWRSPCAASTFHAYRYGGTYEVTLTVIDTGGNTARVTQPITVVGPAPPPPAAGAPGAGAAGAAAPSTAAAPGESSPTVVLPGPVASAAAVSSSLKQVTRSGLVVHYSVNEQVAGRFEVLLGAGTAQGLGIAGRPATELPAGSPKSLVIGQALLVTTKGGHNSVRIKFSKRVSKRLRRAHKIKLTLRLRVRNAAKSPLFTTVMSTVVLHR